MPVARGPQDGDVSLRNVAASCFLWKLWGHRTPEPESSPGERMIREIDLTLIRFDEQNGHMESGEEEAPGTIVFYVNIQGRGLGDLFEH